jgi:Zn-dependent protease
MSRHTISIGRIIGIPIELDYSWFLIFALLTWSFASSYYPAEFKNWSPATYWIMGVLTALFLFGSVLVHELGHSVVAMRYKISIRRITLFLFGGVAQIASEPPSASAEFWIAIAGPVTSFLLAMLFYLLQPLVISYQPALGLIEYLASINLLLVYFNLIPGFPLDGGRVFRAAIWRFTHSLKRATIISANVGRFIAFVFIFIGFWQIFSGNWGNGLWIAFIGWFLDNAAVSQTRHQMVEEFLSGHRVSDVMSKNFTEVSQDVTLQQLIDEHILAAGRKTFFVKSRNDDVSGLLTLHRLKDVPRERWHVTRVNEVMIPYDKMKRTNPDCELIECLDEMNRDGVNQLPVMEGTKLLGMLTREDIVNFLQTLQQFGH